MSETKKNERMARGRRYRLARLKQDDHAVSPVVATLILILVAVAFDQFSELVLLPLTLSRAPVPLRPGPLRNSALPDDSVVFPWICNEAPLLTTVPTTYTNTTYAASALATKASTKRLESIATVQVTPKPRNTALRSPTTWICWADGQPDFR